MSKTDIGLSRGGRGCLSGRKFSAFDGGCAAKPIFKAGLKEFVLGSLLEPKLAFGHLDHFAGPAPCSSSACRLGGTLATRRLAESLDCAGFEETVDKAGLLLDRDGGLGGLAHAKMRVVVKNMHGDIHLLVIEAAALAALVALLTVNEYRLIQRLLSALFAHGWFS